MEPAMRWSILAWCDDPLKSQLYTVLNGIKIERPRRFPFRCGQSNDKNLQNSVARRITRVWRVQGGNVWKGKGKGAGWN